MVQKPAAGKKAAAKKGRWNLYETSGGKISKKNKFCPKCGDGFFLGTSANRVYCGNCHYTEFKKKE